MASARFVATAALGLGLAVMPTASQALSLQLTTLGERGAIGAALFELTPPPEASGSGRFDPFLRIGSGGSDPTDVAGYNTDGILELDTKPGSFTHSIRLSDVPLAFAADVAYLEFVLDANEPGGAEASLLRIDEIQIFLGPVSDLTGYDPGAPTLAGLAPVYRLDATGDHSVTLSANFSGSGRGDLRLLLPTQALASGEGDYLYFYSAFGLAGDGFEEWGLRAGPGGAPPPSVPEPKTALLLALGLGGLAWLSRPRHSQREVFPAAAPRA